MPKEIVAEPPVKHTPGPWLHGKVSDEIITPAGEGVASPCDGYDEEQWAADAPLIAAAPEMLDLLKVTAGNIRSLGPAGAFKVLAPYQLWLQAIEDVIAKAEGR